MNDYETEPRRECGNEPGGEGWGHLEKWEKENKRNRQALAHKPSPFLKLTAVLEALQQERVHVLALESSLWKGLQGQKNWLTGDCEHSGEK